MFDKIARSFNRSRATRAVALNISKAFDRVWHAGLLQKLRSFGISGQILALFILFWRLRVVLDMKSSQNIQLMLEFFKGPLLVLRFSYYTSMTFLMMLSVILLSMLMILLSTVNVIMHLICGNN